MYEGCSTALVTPMNENSNIDYDNLRKLVEFQIENGVNGILAVGTTGESGTLDWEEHENVIEFINEHTGDKCITIGGTGSNCSEEAMEATEHADEIGVEAVLLVEPYYNGPSSLEIRKEYIAPIAEEFPDLGVIPYVIPGRSGTQLNPQDLAVLAKKYDNIQAVKEASGDLENIRTTRELCGEDFHILSGDDGRTFNMLTSKDISASGAISVVSNVAPGTIQEMIEAVHSGDMERALDLRDSLKPLTELVTVTSKEETPHGESLCRARNPLPFKTLMNILGMGVGPCRPPLGKMTSKGLEKVLEKAREVHRENPEILEPVEDFFSVDLDKRLYEERYWRGLSYD
ncbi:MAG: 4-hydroxy-tetrahydrodipicolinate synthase [Candidatus Thermoplasmatota archaeon]|nr:4-hydroxy-tetrahydrodipicolinate synthase [Candidatus Thermoplasmatota archaeon]